MTLHKLKLKKKKIDEKKTIYTYNIFYTQIKI
jgi:hypothetical protein